jgi:MFS family permease
LAVEYVDELYAGVFTLAAPGVQEEFAISYQGTAATLLVVPTVVAMVLEPAIFLLADRYPRRWFVVGGLLAMAFAAFLSALAPGPAVLSLSVSLAFVASGCGVALAQATLADNHPEERERVMARWALMGELGDLTAPVVFALLGVLSLGWRAGYLVVGAVTAGLALLVWRRGRFDEPPASDDDEDEPGLLAAFRTALGNRRLLLWLLACFTCGLLDEVFVVFAALRLRDELGAGVELRSLVIGVCIAGGILGLIVVERWVNARPLHVLMGSAVLCALSYVGWLLAPNLAFATVALFFVGVTAAAHYPIAIAQAYAALPGRSGAVNAAGHLFTPLSLAVPWALGWVADRYGTTAALTFLLAQPLVLVGLVLYVWRTSRAVAAETNRGDHG